MSTCQEFLLPSPEFICQKAYELLPKCCCRGRDASKRLGAKCGFQPLHQYKCLECLVEFQIADQHMHCDTQVKEIYRASTCLKSSFCCQAVVLGVASLICCCCEAHLLKKLGFCIRLTSSFVRPARPRAGLNTSVTVFVGWACLPDTIKIVACSRRFVGHLHSKRHLEESWSCIAVVT